MVHRAITELNAVILIMIFLTFSGKSENGTWILTTSNKAMIRIYELSRPNSMFNC